MLATIRRLIDSESWLLRLPGDAATIDRRFEWLESRRRTQDVRRAAQPRQPAVERAWPDGPDRPFPRDEIERDQFVVELDERTDQEMGRVIAGMPRGAERSRKWPTLTHAHRLRTRRAVERELRIEWRYARMSAPPVDLAARIRGEVYCLDAELGAERHAETYHPLTESEMREREIRRTALREILELDGQRRELERRRGAAPSEDDGGNLGRPERQRVRRASDALEL